MKQAQVHKRTLLLAFLAAAILVAAAPFASAEGITCRSGPGCLNGNDFINWATTYGPPFSPIPNDSWAYNPDPDGSWTDAERRHRMMAFVNFAGGGDGERRDQGNGWAGNFTNGDELLWTKGQGPLTLELWTNGPPVQAPWA